MCIALPARLVAVEGEVGVVDAVGRRVAVNLAFTPEARVGSWLIVHSGVAVRVVHSAEAAAARRLAGEAVSSA